MVEDIANTGIMVARRRGAAAELVEGKNTIDDEFWKTWREQNEKTDLVQRTFVFEDKKEEA